MSSTIIRESFEVNLKVMHIFGLYPTETKTFLYKIQAYIMYCLLIIPVPILGCLYLLLKEDIDLVQVADNAFLLAEMGCYITKFLPFISDGNRIKTCIHFFESQFFTELNSQGNEIINNCKKICRRNTTIYLFMVSGGVTSWAIKPLFWKNYRLPIDIWLPFNVLEDLRSYYLVYFYLVVAVAYAAFSSGVTNPLIAGLACHATSQLQVLKKNLQNLSQYPNKQMKFARIKEYINHHDAILSFVKEYEECFSLVVFSQFVGSVLVICVSCLQLIFVEPFSFNFFSMIMYLCSMLGEIYLCCYYGTTLYEEIFQSNTLANAVYLDEWYDYDEESKKALMILMERSKKPIVIRAGKILDLSLVTFSSILKKSYSLLAVLQNYK